MKKTLFAVALIAVALAACSKKEEPVAVNLPPPATAPSLNNADAPAAQAAAPAATPPADGITTTPASTPAAPTDANK